MKKICFSAILLFCFLVSVPASTQNVIEKKSVTGSWLGKINTGAIQLRVVFNLSLIDRDSLVATLDSPDQGAKNIKLGPVTLTGSTLRITAPTPSCRI